jgi:hypothetical protein
MCVCNPSIRTPWCGKPGCTEPAAGKIGSLEANAASVAEQYAEMLDTLEREGGLKIPRSTTGQTPPWQVASIIVKALRGRGTAHEHQHAPVKHRHARPIQDLVIEDIEARKKVGLERYGTLLQAHNGRDALMDAYQEALDLAVYLRQAIEERA